MSFILMNPKVKFEEALPQPPAEMGLQPQANVASSDLARLSLQASDNNAPITSQALRDVAVRKFVTNHGLEYRGDIYEMMEQEADRMVGRGLFRSRDEAENAIWDAYEVFVQKADPQEVSKAIDNLSDPDKIAEATDARLEAIQTEYETLAAELESAEQALSPLRMAWLGCHVKLKPFGLDGTAPGWEKRAENLLKQTPDPHKRRRLRPLLQEELAARQAYNAASQKCDTLRKQITDNREHTPNFVRVLVTEELETFEDFLCSCRDPGKRKMNAYVQYRLAGVQTAYRNARELSNQTIELSDQLKRAGAETSKEYADLEESHREQCEGIAAIMKTLGNEPLDHPDLAQLEAQARAVERFVDLGDLDQAEAWLEKETVELIAHTRAQQEISRTLDITLGGFEAIDNEYRRILAEVLKNLPGIDQMIPLMVEKEETFHYEGPHEQEVAVLIALFKLRTHAVSKIDKLLEEEKELSDLIRKKRVRLGFDRPHQLESFTKSDDAIKAFLALRGKEKRRMDHFLWMAALKPDPILFDPNSYIHLASKAELIQMILLSLASRKMDQFHASVKHLEGSNNANKHTALQRAWDNLLLGSPTENIAGRIAQDLLLEAVWGLRGMINPRGECHPDGSRNYGDTIGQCDAPVFEAIRRLSKNNLMLFKDQNERDAIASFVKMIQAAEDRTGRIVGIEDMTLALAVLKAASPEAHQLLSFAIGNGTAQGEANGPDYFSKDARESDYYLIYCYDIAKEFASFDSKGMFASTNSDVSDPNDTTHVADWIESY